MQTAIYCRVSTEEQATEGFSIHAQKDKLTKYAESNDWDIVDYYVDDGISGKNLTDRKEVSRLIKDSEGYDVIEDIEDEAERAEVQNAVKEILSSIE